MSSECKLSKWVEICGSIYTGRTYCCNLRRRNFVKKKRTNAFSVYKRLFKTALNQLRKFLTVSIRFHERKGSSCQFHVRYPSTTLDALYAFKTFETQCDALSDNVFYRFLVSYEKWSVPVKCTNFYYIDMSIKNKRGHLSSLNQKAKAIFAYELAKQEENRTNEIKLESVLLLNDQRAVWR